MFRQVGILIAIAIASSTVGAAASLTFSGGSVGAARVAVPRCTNAGLTVLPNLSSTNIASITISGIPATCGGAHAQAAVNNGVASGSGSLSVPAGGGSVTVPLNSTPAISTVAQIDILLTGS